MSHANAFSGEEFMKVQATEKAAMGRSIKGPVVFAAHAGYDLD